MDAKTYREFLDAVDTVCINCHYGTEETCKDCPVRKTCDKEGNNIKTKHKKMVYGLNGIKDFIVEHLDDMENGSSIEWLVDTPENYEGLSFDELVDECSERCCIHMLDHDACFDCHDTVLYMDYMGGYYPHVIVVNNLGWEGYLSACLNELDMDSDKWYYIEVVKAA